MRGHDTCHALLQARLFLKVVTEAGSWVPKKVSEGVQVRQRVSVEWSWMESSL